MLANLRRHVRLSLTFPGFGGDGSGSAPKTIRLKNPSGSYTTMTNVNVRYSRKPPGENMPPWMTYPGGYFAWMRAGRPTGDTTNTGSTRSSDSVSSGSQTTSSALDNPGTAASRRRAMPLLASGQTYMPPLIGGG